MERNNTASPEAVTSTEAAVAATDRTYIRNQLQQYVFASAALQCTNPFSGSIFSQLSRCHTAQQGMHRMRCSDSDCGHEQYQYHNCGNRHCPNCGGMRRQQWLEDKTGELLPTAYYHVVFTLPHELNSLIMGNRKTLLALLFEASGYTLLKLAKDKKWLGAKPGIISILHTWGQQLSFHPHVHCIVSGGGVLEDSRGMPSSWVTEKRKSHRFLFPMAVMEQVFKAYFLKRLQAMLQSITLQLQEEDKRLMADMFAAISKKRWNVYAKRPFGGPLQVLEYLGRYTHKVAITAHRILKIDKEQGTITFKYKDYKQRDTKQETQQMTLSIKEFARRFEQHFLPRHFVKIRHYGYLRNHNRSARLRLIFDLMQLPPPPPKVQVPASQRMLEQHGIDIFECPRCKVGRLEMIATYYHGVLCKTYENQTEHTMHATDGLEIRNKDPSKET